MCEFEQQDQTSGAQQARDSLNISRLTLNSCKDVDPVATFHTMVVSWDTGASFVLSPFKNDFVDYVECDIPVKYVTKSNKVVVILTTIHRFKNIKG